MKRSISIKCWMIVHDTTRRGVGVRKLIYKDARCKTYRKRKQPTTRFAKLGVKWNHDNNVFNYDK